MKLTLAKIQDLGYGVLAVHLSVHGDGAISAIHRDAEANLFGPDFERFVRSQIAERAGEAFTRNEKVDQAYREVESLKLERAQLKITQRQAMMRLDGERLAAKLSRLQAEDAALSDRIMAARAGLDQLLDLAVSYRRNVLGAAGSAGHAWADQQCRTQKEIADEFAAAVAPLLEKYIAATHRNRRLREMADFRGSAIAETLLPPERPAPAKQPGGKGAAVELDEVEL